MENKKNKWYSKMPNTYVILFAIIIFATALTWIIQPGAFERVAVEGTNRLVIVPGTFHEVDGNPAGIFEMFTAIPKGLQAASNIIFMILISSGAFKIINSTGALENSIGVLLRKINKSKIPSSAVVYIVTFLFSCLGLVVGPEIQIPFTVIGVSIALGLGYDLIVGLAMIVVGGGIGFALGPICASTIGTSQAIAGLPLFSGMLLRTVCWLTATIAGASVIVWYGNKVKKNPEKSLVNGISTEGLGFSKNFDEYTINKKDKYVLLALLGLFIALIIGPIKYGWYLDEMMTAFLVVAIIVAIITKMPINKAIDIFTSGAGVMFGAAMMVGLGRAIQIILENGNILDSVIYGLSQKLDMFGKYSSAIIMTIIHGLINFLIPSGSGQAAATIPIMFPLGEVVGLTNQVSILAFQIGDGITNIIYPTLGSLMAMCGLARVPFGKWVKFAYKVVLIVYAVTWVFLLFAVKINWGPF
ncbi:YfcC family protein [Clostridium polynesiense]|uniref:YfcC family protein n=1 Tax=Clostridium polynesiense TaxID=1325933 RepID=UPI00058F9F9D|nr:TIGR00366 family protein [Clostridium polynesiense]